MKTIQCKRFYTALFVALLLSVSCKKDEVAVGTGNKPSTQGSLYWGWTSGRTVNLANGAFGEVLTENWFDGFDVSWDNKKLLSFTDFGLGTFNFTDYRVILRPLSDGPLTFSNFKDGKNVVDFLIEWEDMMNTNGRISPNEKYIALNTQTYSDLPISIIDVEKKDFLSMFEVSGLSASSYGQVVWSADNTLYFRVQKTLYKSSPSDNYRTANPVVTFPETVTWSVVNPQGTKIVMRKNKHLWLCNIDGSDMKQITNSETLDFIEYDGESKPTFSPDGKYIAFVGATKRGTPWSDHDYPDGSWVASVGGKYGYIIIIPADGNLYNLDDKNSGAYWLKEGSSHVPCSGDLIWR